MAEIDPGAVPPPLENCGGCKYFFPVANPPGYVGIAGECHAGPPEAGQGWWGKWPICKATEWCGRYMKAA